MPEILHWTVYLELFLAIIRVIYDETAQQMKRLGWWGELKISGTRKAMSGSLRYCLQNNVLFLPEDESILTDKHRLCWGAFRGEDLLDYPWLAEFDQPTPKNPLTLDLPFFSSIGFGVQYSRRHKEEKNGRVSVSAFVAQDLVDEIAENPDALLSVSKNDFEALIAELFTRRGFEVDLLRSSKDDGIDFLAVRNEDTSEPIIFAVQTKHPDQTNKRGKRNILPVSTVREIYGVAKAWNLSGAIAVTSSTYSPAAKQFADMKPNEIEVVDAARIIEWARKYRWNPDD